MNLIYLPANSTASYIHSHQNSSHSRRYVVKVVNRL